MSANIEVEVVFPSAVPQYRVLDLGVACKRDAKLFLLGGGPWAASRRAWCEVADINEGRLHRRVRAILKGEAEIETGKWRSGRKSPRRSVNSAGGVTP